MKLLIKLEDFAFFLGSLYVYSLQGWNWWWFLLLLLAPDISMIGYLRNTKVGAFLYNLIHHRGVCLFLFFIGIFLKLPVLQFAAIIMFAHSSLDRIFDYGFKYPDNFKHTHLS